MIRATPPKYWQKAARFKLKPTSYKVGRVSVWKQAIFTPCTYSIKMSKMEREPLLLPIMSRCLSHLLVFALWGAVWAQQPKFGANPVAAKEQTYIHKILQSEHGLPATACYALHQDAKGYLWVGTYGGLSRFDGRGFKNYTVNDGLGANQICAIGQDAQQNLWLGTFVGISIFDGKTFRNVNTIHGVTVERCRSIYLDSRQNVWGTCLNGLWKFDTHTRQYQLFNRVTDGSLLKAAWHVIELGKGRFMVSNREKCYLFNGKIFTEIKSETGESVPAVSFLMYRGQLLVGTSEAGWKVFQNGKLKPFWKDERLDKAIVYGQAVDREENIWLSARNQVFVWKNNQLVAHIPGSQFVESDYCFDVLTDTEGTIWMATFEGLVQFKKGFIDRYTHQNGLPNNDWVYSLRADGDRLYLGGRHEVYSFQNETFSKPIRGLSPKIDLVWNIRRDLDDNIWLPTVEDGVFKMVDGAFKKTLEVKEIFGFAQHPINRSIWLGGRNDLWHYAGDTLTRFGPREGYRGQDVLSLYFDKQQRLWIGCMGLWMYDGKRFHDFSRQVHAENVLIQTIEADPSGPLWIGTMGRGIKKIAIDGPKPQLLEEIGQREGLTNESIVYLKFDNEGQLWVDSFGGVLRMDLTKPKQNGAYPTRIFTPNDGVIRNSWRDNPMEKDHAGNIWIGTPNGVMRFRVKDIYKNPQPPKIHISGVEVLQNAVTTSLYSDVSNAPLEARDLSADQNHLTFQYSGISLSDPDNVRFTYQLSGVDETWSVLAHRGSVTYPKLAPNRYVFRVKAINSDGVWSEVASFSFTIRPPFYQTWWFRCLLAIGFAGLIYGLLKYRTRQQQQKMETELQIAELKLKAVQSQMNPHFLFNSLNSVQHYLLTNQGIEGAKYLSKFSKLVRRIMENSNHQYLRFEQIVETLRMYVEIEAFRFNHEFSYEFRIDDDDETLMDAMLPPMLLQPYVENSIWHGLMPKEGPKKLLISAFTEKGHIVCMIEDNGVGRNFAPRKEDHVSRGQEMTQGIFDSLRHKDSKARIEVVDLIDPEGTPTGTRTKLIIPLTNS